MIVRNTIPGSTGKIDSITGKIKTCQFGGVITIDSITGSLVVFKVNAAKFPVLLSSEIGAADSNSLDEQQCLHSSGFSKLGEVQK